MKLFKFGIVICSVLIGVGVVGTGASIGKMYNETQLTYTFDLEEALNPQALKEVYINSDMPIRIEETTGEPRVGFETAITGVMIPQPKYELKVKTVGEASYITMNSKRDGIQMILDEEGGELVVYLPKQEIDLLEVKTDNYYWQSQLDYKGTNPIKELKVKGVRHMNLDLRGEYENISLESHGGGTVKVDSKTPVELEAIGDFDDIKLVGQYKDIDLTVRDSVEVDIISDIPCRLTINDQEYGQKQIYLEGQFLDMDLQVLEGQIEMIPTIEPKRVKIEGNNIGIKMMLPQSHKGFDLIYDNYDESYGESSSQFYTNLDVESRPIGEVKQRVTYGDKIMVMVIEGFSNKISVIQ